MLDMRRQGCLKQNTTITMSPKNVNEDKSSDYSKALERLGFLFLTRERRIKQEVRRHGQPD